MMTPPLADSPLLVTPEEDAAKPHPDPGVQGRECPLGAVFEVLEPASQHGVEAVDEGGQAVAVEPSRELADTVLERHEALLCARRLDDGDPRRLDDGHRPGVVGAPA